MLVARSGATGERRALVGLVQDASDIRHFHEEDAEIRMRAYEPSACDRQQMRVVRNRVSANVKDGRRQPGGDGMR